MQLTRHGLESEPLVDHWRTFMGIMGKRVKGVPHPLLDPKLITSSPSEYLDVVGEIFAKYEGDDSGNVAFGVAVDAQRFFVKTAGESGGQNDTGAMHSHAELTQQGWIAVDFYDGSLMYNFGTGTLRVIDLDMYRDKPFRNVMGRMFGSSRFMAPEEFELGALVDERTTVFVMGRAAAVFLADGTLTGEAFRGPAALLDVVRKACSPDPIERYQTVAAFHGAWSATWTDASLAGS